MFFSCFYDSLIRNKRFFLGFFLELKSRTSNEIQIQKYRFDEMAINNKVIEYKIHKFTKQFLMEKKLNIDPLAKH